MVRYGVCSYNSNVLSIILSILWMLFFTLVLNRSKLPDKIIDSYPFLKVPLMALLFIFWMRIWFVCVTDTINVVNSVFGVFGCSPIYEEFFIFK